MPGPNRSGVKMMLPSVSRIWLFSMPFGARLALLVLEAVGVVHAEPGGDLLVVVVVAERAVEAKLAGRRQPLQHERLRVELVVELRRADAKRAQVVGEHRHVLELGLQPRP